MVDRISPARTVADLKRYCITDSAAVAARVQNVEMIQLRAKNLSARQLHSLVVEVVQSTGTPVLVNTRLDVALACGAAGVHLPANSIAPAELRCVTPEHFLIGVSCHTAEELQAAEREGADFAVFGPIFASPSKPVRPVGLAALRQAILGLSRLPVYALGGVTEANAAHCIDAGAAGVAGISLFDAPG
jgi:thiamine-phosphate pyrophosphorylase